MAGNYAIMTTIVKKRLIFMMDNYSEQIVKKRVNPAKFTFLILYFVFAFIFILLTVYLSQFLIG